MITPQHPTLHTLYPSPAVRFARYVLPALLWMGVIFYLSTGSGSAEKTNPLINILLHRYLPALAERLTNAQMEQIDFAIRKAAHVTEYAILGLLLYRAFRGGRIPFRHRDAALTLLLGALYAASDEYHQSFVPGRWATPEDAMIDTAGVTLGLALSLWRHAANLWQRLSAK